MNNKDYATIGGIELNEMNELESLFLEILDFELYISNDEFENYSRLILENLNNNKLNFNDQEIEIKKKENEEKKDDGFRYYSKNSNEKNTLMITKEISQSSNQEVNESFSSQGSYEDLNDELINEIMESKKDFESKINNFT